MPYPHVTQFETLDRRRRGDAARLPTPAQGAGEPRRLVFRRPGRLRRAARCASAAT